MNGCHQGVFFRVAQQLRDLLMEFGHVGFNDLPNSNIVDEVVPVDKQIAKGDMASQSGISSAVAGSVLRILPRASPMISKIRSTADCSSRLRSYSAKVRSA